MVQIAKYARHLNTLPKHYDLTRVPVMIAGSEEKNSRLGSNVNPLLVLPYEVHFGFGIEPKHSSDRLIGSRTFTV